MRLDVSECRRRLVEADHGVLATRHPDRGVDAVPVCFAVVGDRVAVPVDRVKPKTTTGLQRVANLDHDARAVLVVEGWDRDDWSRLWWVQAHLQRLDVTDGDGAFVSALAHRYPQYRDQAAIAAVTVFAVARLTGWAGADSPP